MKCFIIAEAGVNHNGSEELALQLVEVAARAGADAVKFQSFKAESLVKPGVKTASYQYEQTRISDQFSMLKQLELSEESYIRILACCNDLNIEFMSTPFDENSLGFLIDLGMKRIKIPSGELTNHPFIAYIAKKNLPMILSTGMSTLEEVVEAVEVIRSACREDGLNIPLHSMLTILHCTSSYPAAFESVNLRAMQTLSKELNLPVGYSDHTKGILISPVAVAMGALVIEKHFTLERSLPGPDHLASLEPHELAQMVKNIRIIEESMGTGEKKPSENELEVRELVRRSAILARDLKANSPLSKEDLIFLRPGNGIAPRDIDKLIGMRLKTDLSAGTLLKWVDVIE